MSKEKEYKKGDFQKIGTFINKKYYNQGWNEALQKSIDKIDKYFGVISKPYKTNTEQLADGIRIDLKNKLEALRRKE